MFNFIETRLFTKLVLDYLNDVECAALQQVLAQNPDAGPVIPGSGGCPQAALGCPWARETRWIPRHLLREARQRRDLAADDVSKERGGQHPDARTPTDTGGG